MHPNELLHPCPNQHIVSKISEKACSSKVVMSCYFCFQISKSQHLHFCSFLSVLQFLNLTFLWGLNSDKEKRSFLCFFSLRIFGEYLNLVKNGQNRVSHNASTIGFCFYCSHIKDCALTKYKISFKVPLKFTSLKSLVHVVIIPKLNGVQTQYRRKKKFHLFLMEASTTVCLSGQILQGCSHQWNEMIEDFWR